MRTTIWAALLAFALASCGRWERAPESGQKDWYEGGTLHKKTAQEWNSATPANRLATAADFVERVAKPVSMVDLKTKATEMEACISKTFAPPPSNPIMSVSEAAADCALLMRW